MNKFDRKEIGMMKLVSKALLRYVEAGDKARARICADSLVMRLARVMPDEPIRAPGISARTRKHFNGRN